MYKKEELGNLITKAYVDISNCVLEVSKELGSYEMQVKQFHYLEIISTTPNLTSSNLAEILNITKPSVTEIVNKLIKLECVYREQCSSDRRVFYLKLSKKGNSVIRTREIAVQKFLNERVPTLTNEEINLFIQLMKKLYP